MARQNKIITNMGGGEVSPKLYGRSDLPLFQKAMAKVQNFIPLVHGGCTYRPGTAIVHHTRLNQVAVTIPFQFNDAQSYIIEATDRMFRFYRDNSVILETAKAVTAMTNANPGVFTSVGHGYSTGDEVYVTSPIDTTSVAGIDGRFLIVVKLTADTFKLNLVPDYDLITDTNIYSATYNTYTPIYIDTTSSGTYTGSGLTVARVYEIPTIYLAEDLETLQYSQYADTMYIATQFYEPIKVTRSGDANWAAAVYARTADPFVPVEKTITGITQANPANVHSVAHGLAVGQTLYIDAVVGMTQANGLFYTVGTVPDADHFTLLDRHGKTPIDSTGWAAYTSGGEATLPGSYPLAVSFTDSGRLLFGGTGANPETVWGSQSPSGTARNYDNFTTGVNDTDAYVFVLAPVNGKVDNIQWISNTNLYPVIGTYGGLRVLYGSGPSAPATPSAINAKAVNGFGCEQTLPAIYGDSLFYIQRGELVLRSIQYDLVTQWYVTNDRSLMAEHLVEAGINKVVKQTARPVIIWGLRNDGKLVGLTYQIDRQASTLSPEEVAAWHQHYIPGQSVDATGTTNNWAKVLDIGRMPRSAKDEQLWLVVERVVGGHTRRTIEYLDDLPVFPTNTDFFTGNEIEDTDNYLNAVFQQQQTGNFLGGGLRRFGGIGGAMSLAIDTNPPGPDDSYHSIAGISPTIYQMIVSDDGNSIFAVSKDITATFWQISKIRIADWTITASYLYADTTGNTPIISKPSQASGGISIYARRFFTGGGAKVEVIELDTSTLAVVSTIPPYTLIGATDVPLRSFLASPDLSSLVTAYANLAGLSPHFINLLSVDAGLNTFTHVATDLQVAATFGSSYSFVEDDNPDYLWFLDVASTATQPKLRKVSRVTGSTVHTVNLSTRATLGVSSQVVCAGRSEVLAVGGSKSVAVFVVIDVNSTGNFYAWVVDLNLQAEIAQVVLDETGVAYNAAGGDVVLAFSNQPSAQYAYYRNSVAGGTDTVIRIPLDGTTTAHLHTPDVVPNDDNWYCIAARDDNYRVYVARADSPPVIGDIKGSSVI